MSALTNGPIDLVFTEEEKMQIASWNVNSISVRLPHVLSWLQTVKPCHLGLQELKVVDEKYPYKQFEELGYTSHVKGEKTYNGVAMLSRTTTELVHDQLLGAPEPVQSRLIEVLTQEGIYILNLYVPNGSEVGSSKYLYKLEWFKSLMKFIETNHKREDKLVVMGDFNIAPADIDVHSPEEWEGQVLVSPQERECFQTLLTEFGLTDSFRHLAPDAAQYSWWDYRMMAFRRNRGLRIDHILVSEPLLPMLKRSWIDKEPRKLEKPSDHAPVVIELEL